MESTQQQINKQQGFDEETKQKIQAYLEEIDNKQQRLQQTSPKSRYIKFVHDKERKLLSFTGKFDKIQVPEKDFETGEVIPGKYVTRHFFECYDITTTRDPSLDSQTEQPSIWERGTKDARTILYYLSKNKKVLEVIRNGQPKSKTTTYQINPPLN